ncbi:hypothetical protein J4477_01800 [Candidatus Pacearchaeota archaeon]|nr:hypothetical protein [Candidatus Pacearchaeota archaeon]
MNKLTTLAILALLIFSSTSLVSAEIIWSQPTTVHFSTGDSGNGGDDECDIFKDPQLIKDMEIENEFYNIQYGEWTCINNRLQRINTVNGFEEVEYGGLCGVLSDSQKEKTSNLFLVSVILIILIILALILIILVFLRKRY